MLWPQIYAFVADGDAALELNQEVAWARNRTVACCFLWGFVFLPYLGRGHFSRDVSKWRILSPTSQSGRYYLWRRRDSAGRSRISQPVRGQARGKWWQEWGAPRRVNRKRLELYLLIMDSGQSWTPYRPTQYVIPSIPVGLCLVGWAGTGKTFHSYRLKRILFQAHFPWKYVFSRFSPFQILLIFVCVLRELGGRRSTAPNPIPPPAVCCAFSNGVKWFRLHTINVFWGGWACFVHRGIFSKCNSFVNKT